MAAEELCSDCSSPGDFHILQKPLAEAITAAVPGTEVHFHRMADLASLEGIGKS